LLSTIVSKSLNDYYKDTNGKTIPVFNVLLSQFNLILLTRISLDDQNQGVLYSSLKLLHSMFNQKSYIINNWYKYYRCLSVGIEYVSYSNLIAPVLASEDISDSDISKSDIIQGLNVMDVFSRLRFTIYFCICEVILRYILEVIKISSFVPYILDILINCSKHSSSMSNNIINVW
jgi:hypothetical protein